VDLHNEKLDPIELVRALRSKEQLKNTPLLGFFSHVQVDLKQAAIEAGYDEVLPRSVFSRDLAKILAGI
jgi:CheY-like chemotaxis protein